MAKRDAPWRCDRSFETFRISVLWEPYCVVHCLSTPSSSRSNLKCLKHPLPVSAVAALVAERSICSTAHPLQLLIFWFSGCLHVMVVWSLPGMDTLRAGVDTAERWFGFYNRQR